MQKLVIIWFVLFAFGVNSLQAQNKSRYDTAWLEYHSAQRATLYSAVLPGLGQAYNHHYWKVPIVYAGFGVIVYFIDFNTQKYHEYRDGYYNLANNTGDESYKQLPSYPTFDADKELILQNFQRNRDYFRRWREISILSFVGFYLLNIIEANISAHFLHFDISDELAFDIIPTITPANALGNKNAGLTLSFRF